MAITRKTMDEYECDACGKVQYGQPGADEITGIHGKATEIIQTGGYGTDFFACSRECLPGAIIAALNRALEH